MVLELLPQKWAAMFTHTRLSKEVSVVVGDGVICKPRLRNGPYNGDRMNFFCDSSRHQSFCYYLQMVLYNLSNRRDQIS
jgi:hypothetical protein